MIIFNKMNCQYCNKTLANQYVLLRHQTTAKYCLNIQNGIVKTKNIFTCKYCNNILASKNMLISHMNICLEKYKFLLDEKDKEIYTLTQKINTILSNHKDDILKHKENISKLEGKLELYEKQETRAYSTIERIAEQPKNITSTTNNNKVLIMTPLEMDIPKFKEAIETGFTNEHLLQGQRGVARFAVDNLLKDEEGNLKYTCTDPSRHMYHYKNADGDIERDVKAKKLTKALLDANLTNCTHALSMEKMKEMGNTSESFMTYTQNWQDIKEMEIDNGVFRAELTTLTTK